MQRIRLLIVDDDATVRRGLRMRLQLEPDVDVAGETSNAADALHLVRALRPNVVLMDVEMPGTDGIEATSEIAGAFPHVAVIVLTIHDDSATRQRAMEAGAYTLVSKHMMDNTLISTIRAAAGQA